MLDVYCAGTAVFGKPLRLPPTRVPAAVNTHMCFGIRIDDIVVNQQLPIAIEPVLDNTAVMHHMELWRCSDIPSKYRPFSVPVHNVDKRSLALLYHHHIIIIIFIIFTES